MNDTKQLLTFALLAMSLCSYGQYFIVDHEILAETNANGISRNVAIADIDMDQDRDIILIMESGEDLILLNTNSRYSKAGHLGQGTQHQVNQDMAIADFDRDGDMDILMISPVSSQHKLYLNNNQGQYLISTLQVNLSGGNMVLAADLNDDAYPDILIGRNGQNILLINKGDGSFRDETRYRLPVLDDETNDLTLFDFDRDGDSDLFVSNARRNYMLVNNGQGGFTDESMTTLPLGPSFHTQAAATADVDHDGDADLYLATVDMTGQQDARDRLFLNVEGKYFFEVTHSQLPPLESRSYDVSFIDVDQDGDLDIATANHGHQPISILENDGFGKFKDVTHDYLGHQEFGQACRIIAGDLNGDQHEDLYICLKNEADRILLRDPDGVAATTTSLTQLKGWAEVTRIYPNPVEQLFTLHLPEEVGSELQFQLYSLTGNYVTRLMPKQSMQSRYQFSLEGIRERLSTGVYLLKIHTDKGVFAKKILLK